MAPMTHDPQIAAALSAAAERFRPLGRWAHGWAKGKLLRDPAYAAALQLLPQHGVLLDVGCGEGYLVAAAIAYRPALRAIGIDHDPRRLHVAERAHDGQSEVSFVQHDAPGAELPRADAIALLDVLHYLPYDAQDGLLRACCTALHVDGVLIVRDAEPGQRWRSGVTRLAERIARISGRHRGHGLFFRSLDHAAATCAASGMTTTITPCAAGTPFSNRLLIARAPKER